MAKQWDFELDWADDEQETVAREEQDGSAVPPVLAAEVPAAEPFDPKQTIMGLGLAPARTSSGGDANVTRPTPGGSRGGYPTPEELEIYNRPTRPIVDQSSLADLRKLVDAGASLPVQIAHPSAPSDALDDLEAPTTKLEVVPDLRAAPLPSPPAPAPAPAPVYIPPSVVPYARTTTQALAVSAPSARRTGSWAALVVTLLAGLALGVWFGAPRDGELRVDVSSAEGASVGAARVYVAGDLRCRTVPCVVRGLEPGLETVRVELDGQRDVILRTAEVTAGQERTLSVFLPAVALHGLRIGEMPGVKSVLVDGVDRGAPPLLLEDLEPGEHHLQFDGGEGVESSRRTVEIEEGTIVEIRDVKLVPAEHPGL